MDLILSSQKKLSEVSYPSLCLIESLKLNVSESDVWKYSTCIWGIPFTIVLGDVVTRNGLPKKPQWAGG